MGLPVTVSHTYLPDFVLVTSTHTGTPPCYQPQLRHLTDLIRDCEYELY